MAFRPDRLTGRRARRYLASLAPSQVDPLVAEVFRPEDLVSNLKRWKVPKTVARLIRQPQHLEIAVRVKAEFDSYHWVAVIRGRVVLLNHPVDRTRAIRFLAGPDARRCNCYDIRDKYVTLTRPIDGRVRASHPDHLPEALTKHRFDRRPPVGTCRTGWEVRGHGYRSVERVTPECRHPTPGLYPWKFSDRWAPAAALHTALARTAAARIAAAVRAVAGVDLTVRIARREPYESAAWSLHTADAPETSPVLEVALDLITWYVRVASVGAVLADGPPGGCPYLVLATSRPPDGVADAPILAEAAPLAGLGTYAAGARGPAATGILDRPAGRWRFIPLPPAGPRRIDDRYFIKISDFDKSRHPPAGG